uniref:Peptidyl-prolyl cis-trans isomerase-like 2 n=1 Tax=Rhizophora mucronata TaxID=61149 RepID=A0A2P2KED2_RHIMU
MFPVLPYIRCYIEYIEDGAICGANGIIKWGKCKAARGTQ